MEKPYKVLIMDFGAGDHLLATPAIRGYKAKFPDHTLVVAAVYTALLQNNRYIDHLYQLGQYHDLYTKWVKPMKNSDDYANLKIYEPRLAFFKDEPMSKLMCDVLNVPFDNDQLDLFLTPEEDEFGRDFCSSFKKPTVVIQAESARVGIKNDEKFINEKDWFPERWDELVKQLSDRYSFVQVGAKNERAIAGVKVNLLGKINLRQTAGIIKHAHTLVAIDSVCQHIANAVKKKSIVLFGRSKIAALGHSDHVNLFVPDSCPDFACMRPEPACGDLVVTKQNTLAAWTCPTNRVCMQAITVDSVASEIIKLSA